jgi:hypothetical protein
MRLAIPAILPSAVPWILLGVVSVLSLSQPSSSHPELVEQQWPLFRPPPPDTIVLERTSLVSEDTYGRLERFAKYASAAYQVLCPYPLGNTLVQSVSCVPLNIFFIVIHFSDRVGRRRWMQFSNMLTHAHGFVARDDGRREIVVAFRGSHELADMVTGT